MSEGSVLKDMGTYKTHIISEFINCDEICECLLDKESYTEEDIKNLFYTQMFPYLYTDETQADALTYLCVEVDVAKIPTNTIKDMKLIVWAYCHQDIMEYSKEGYSGTRIDILADIVERKLRNSNKFGIGKLELQSVANFSPQKKYYGKQLIFNVPDFKIKR